MLFQQFFKRSIANSSDDTQSVHLEFQPVGIGAKLHHATFGQLVFAQTFRELSSVSPELTPEARDTLQKRVSTRLLNHWRVKLEIKGLENIVSGPYLIASLHEGMADVLCLLQLPLGMRFVAREEIFNWQYVGGAITRLGHVAINPERGALSFRPLLKAAERVLAGGESLVIFAQGAVAGIEGDFQRGIFEIGKRLGIPILPVVIAGSHRIWEHPHTAKLRYGQRIGIRVLSEISVQVLQNQPLEQVRLQLQRQMKAVALCGELPAPRHYKPQQDGYWDGYRFDMDPDFPEVYTDFNAHREAYLAGLKAKKL